MTTITVFTRDSQIEVSKTTLSQIPALQSATNIISIDMPHTVFNEILNYIRYKRELPPACELYALQLGLAESPDQTYKINVGGTMFLVKVEYLLHFDYYKALVDRWIGHQQVYFLDMDPTAFRHLLLGAMNHQYTVPKYYQAEVEYLGLHQNHQLRNVASMKEVYHDLFPYKPPIMTDKKVVVNKCYSKRIIARTTTQLYDERVYVIQFDKPVYIYELSFVYQNGYEMTGKKLFDAIDISVGSTLLYRIYEIPEHETIYSITTVEGKIIVKFNLFTLNQPCPIPIEGDMTIFFHGDTSTVHTLHYNYITAPRTFTNHGYHYAPCFYMFERNWSAIYNIENDFYMRQIIIYPVFDREFSLRINYDNKWLDITDMSCGVRQDAYKVIYTFPNKFDVPKYDKVFINLAGMKKDYVTVVIVGEKILTYYRSNNRMHYEYIKQ